MPLQPVTFEHFEVARLPDGSLHELGRGAMGVTYKAYDTRLGSYVALKVINPDGIKSEVGRARFEREAKAAAHLNHPNVAAIFHRGQEGGAYFYAMQFIEGETFDAFVKRRGPLPAALALRLILQAAQGLAAASTRGLIHRDIKPANLMLVHPEADAGQPPVDTEPDDDDLLVKVIDFGLAKYLNKSADSTDASLTGDRIVGTPHYMSPEQIDPVGKEIDARADIYALGVTLWHLLSGRPPFRGTEFQVFNQHMSQSLPWEQLPAAVPAQVHDLIERMMAKDRANRPASHRELIGLIKQQLRSLASGGGTAADASRSSSSGLTPPRDVVEQSRGLPQPPADFSLEEVLRRRGHLTTDEVLGLTTLLAPIIDAKREHEEQAYDLTPARICVRFDLPPGDADDLPAQSMDTWPPSQLEIATLHADASGTPPPETHPARPLGALTYELLAGHPPTDLYQSVPTLNGRVNALLRQVLEGLDSFGTAVRFAEAFRLSLAGELHVPVVPVVPAAETSGFASDTREYTPVGSLLPSAVPQAREFPWAAVGVVLLLALVGGGWWYLGRGGGMASRIPSYLLSTPPPPPTVFDATVSPPAAPAAAPPETGSITTRAVRRYAPPPFYPPAAKAARQQGKVLLSVDVDAAGNVAGVSVKESSGHSQLDEAAMQAMRVWKFDPARTNGVAVPSRTEQPVEFKVPVPMPEPPGAPGASGASGASGAR